MNNFKGLNVWKKSIELVKLVYSVTSCFPKEEQYGIKQQIQRASVSIPSNIAEGAGRSTEKEFKRFLSISLGSCYELETQFVICRELGLISEDSLSVVERELEEIEKMVRGLQKSLG